MAIRDLETSQISESILEEIRQLHAGIIGHARQSLTNAIRIGEILTQIKAVLKHGDWQTWIDSNLPFTYRTAHRYISCFDRREQIKSDNLSLLGEAYSLLTASSTNCSNGQQQLHESNFWVKNSKLGQTWFGTINHELKDRPLEKWRRDQLIDLASTIEPFIELYQRLKNLIG